LHRLTTPAGGGLNKKGGAPSGACNRDQWVTIFHGVPYFLQNIDEILVFPA
jgi:hypothetical protein